MGKSSPNSGIYLPTKITKLPDLLNQVRNAKRKIAQLKLEGLYLSDAWLEKKLALNTKQPQYYWRLRTKHGLFPNGRKTMYVRQDEVQKYRKAIALGREIKKLERFIKLTSQRAARLIKRAELRGIVIQNPLGDADSSHDWYTPLMYVEMVRQVLGTIDLDPASNDTAQQWIQAGRYYTKEDDGLNQPWFLSVYLNPPYGSPEVRLLAQKFLEKAIFEYQSGNITAAILLLNRTGASWYKKLLHQVTALCEVHKRISFIDKHGMQQRSPRYYNDFLYLGKEPEKFKSVFEKIGNVTIFEKSLAII
ncbi:hypothetical protein HW132_27875 [Brasilonema sp. CT11]|nr:hypothetical protein [Brasilonema sp. CT11]